MITTKTEKKPTPYQTQQQNQSTMEYNFRTNNLNLIRLFAAFQVLIGHLHYCFEMPSAIKYISLFNGVPIFFTLSGFLIYWSFDHHPDVRTYGKNRILRIYPALIVSLVCTINRVTVFIRHTGY